MPPINSVPLLLYDLYPAVVNWLPNRTVVNGKYVETVVIWRLGKFAVKARLGACNDN